jgi:hypothetical protein
LKQIRKRLTYANVMSSLAVFLVLGGATAFAAIKKVGPNEIKANSIKTGKIVKEAVTAGKLKNSAVTESKLADGAVTGGKLADNAVTTPKIADNAVTTPKIANDTVTGEKVKESTLGTVPSATDAQQLGGLPASSYAKSQLEAVHEIGAPGQPVFENGCNNNNVSAFGEAGFYKDGFGIVHLVGVLSGCTSGNSTFTLPAGFRPTDANLMVVAASENTSGEVSVLPSGEVKVFGTTAPRLFGLTFRVG